MFLPHPFGSSGALATAAGLKTTKDLVSRPPAIAGHKGALLQGLVILTRAHRFEMLLTTGHGLWRIGDHVAAPVFVIGQLVPRQRVVVLTQAEEAAKAHDSIGDLT